MFDSPTPGPHPGVRPQRPWRAALALLALLAPAPCAATVSFDSYSLPVGESPQGLAASDCDGDGRPDLVVANLGSDTVTILRNDGRGHFGVWATIPTGAQPAGATCTDLTGDGRADLVVSSFSTARIIVHRAEPDGTFTRVAEQAVGEQPRSVSSADFDGDGNLDVLVVNARSSGLSLLLGDGTGALPFSSTIRLPPQRRRNAPVSAAVADYDRDGYPDIAVVSQGDPPLRILSGGPLGFELTERRLPLPPNPRSAASADLDGDGRTDVASTRRRGGRLDAILSGGF